MTNISQWSKAHERMQPEAWPAIGKKSLVNGDATIFTIGSCFARNIEEHLARLGFNIPTLSFWVPKTEWINRPNGILNKYTPPSIYQEIAWAADIYDRDGIVAANDVAHLAFESNSRYVDLQLAGFTPVTFERLLERRQQVYDLFKEVFTCELVVLTLGLTEVWLDTKTNYYIQQTPTTRELLKDKKRFQFQVLNHATCLDFVQKTIQIVQKRNPKVQFLLTASPVPLERTFTDDDVIIANMHSKSTLRSVCGEVVDHRTIHYFPSYESVMLTKSWDVWAPDFRHVADSFVGKIVAKLCDTYFVNSVNESSRLYQKSFLRQPLQVSIDHVKAALAIEESPRYLVRLAELYIRAKQFDNAEQCVRRVFALEPENCEAFSLSATIEEQRGNIEAAIANLEQAIHGSAKQNPALFVRLSKLFELAQRPEDAHQAFLTACTLHPHLLLERIHQSNELFVAGNVEGAIQSIREAIGYNAEEPRLHAQLGNLLMRSGDLDGSEAAYNRVLSLDQTLPEPHLQLSFVHARKGDIKTSLEHIRNALALKGDDLHYYIHFGNLLLRAGELDEAEAAYDKAIAMDPNAPDPYIQLSHVYVRKGNMEKSLESARQALALKQDNFHYFNHYGNLLMRANNLAAAQEAYLQAIALDPKMPDPHFQLSQLHLREGRLEDAVASVRRAIALDASNAQFQAHLEALLAQAGNS